MMGDWFWLLVLASAAAAPLIGIANVGAFVLTRRAGLQSPRSHLVRGVLLLAAVFVFPRILPGFALWFGLIVVLLSWEVVARIRHMGTGHVQSRSLPLTNHP
jgi:hypothetical protein